MAAVEMNEAAKDVVERILSDYLDEVDGDDIDTADLAENIVMGLERMTRDA